MFHVWGSTTLCTSRSGWFRIDGERRPKLFLARPDDAHSGLFVPMPRRLFDVLHRPDLLAAELSAAGGQDPDSSTEHHDAERGWHVPEPPAMGVAESVGEAKSAGEAGDGEPRPSPGAQSVPPTLALETGRSAHPTEGVDNGPGAHATAEATLRVAFEQAGWEPPRAWNGKALQVMSLGEPPQITYVPHPVSLTIDEPRAGTPTIPSQFLPRIQLSPINDQTTLAGRDSLLDDVVLDIESNTSVRLLGPRRAGKTSIIHTLANRLRKSGHSVRRVSLQEFGGSTPADLAAFLEPALLDQPHAHLELAKLLTQENRPVFLLDEIVALSRVAGDVFGWLRSRADANAQEGHAVIVYVATPWEWSQVLSRSQLLPGSLFANNLANHVVGPLDEESGVRLVQFGNSVTENAEPVPATDDATARKIVHAVDGWPFYLLELCRALVHRERSRAEKTRSLSDADVTTLIQTALIEARHEDFQHRWDELPDDARQLLLRDKRRLPPDFESLSNSDLKLGLSTGLTTTTDWCRDAPYFEWMRINRHRLDR